jgi:hypothetical protein
MDGKGHDTDLEMVGRQGLIIVREEIEESDNEDSRRVIDILRG